MLSSGLSAAVYRGFCEAENDVIAAVYGTTAEIIKLAPILLTLRDQDIPVVSLCTAQQSTQISPVLEQFGLPHPDVWLAHGRRGRDLERQQDIPPWLLTVAFNFAKRYRSLRRRLRASGRPIVLVHGDTMTTVIGAVLARALGADAAHVEAGLRSHDWRNPFPEELNRRAVAHIANVHFAPGAVAALNLAHVRGRVIDTRANTVRDAFMAAPRLVDPRVPLPDGHFGIVSLHRHELIDNRDRFTGVLTLLSQASQSTPLLFIDHAVTAARIADYDLTDLFDETNFVRIPKLEYFAFVTLLKAARFVVTDSGGLQEECAVINMPCAVYREVSERMDGLGSNALLCGGDDDALRDFLKDPGRFHVAVESTFERPSDVIVRFLVDEGYAR